MTEKSYIQIIDPEDAIDNILKRAYKRIGGSRGSIAHVHQSQSLNPKAMMAHLDLYMAIMYQESPLDRIQRELLGAVVSYFNKCEYCIVHHYEALQFHWKDAPPLEQISQGTGINNRYQLLVKFAKKLTLESTLLSKEDIDELRSQDFDDRAILDIVLIISYFNFVNRLVVGTGIQLEDQEDRDYKY